MLFCFGIVDETVNRAAITFWLSHFEMLVQVFSSFEKSNRWVKTLLPFVRCMTFNINCSILFKPHLRMICSKGVYIYSKHFAKWSFYIWISSQIKNVRSEFINPLHCIMYMQTYESCSHEWWQTGNKQAEWKDILNPLSYAHIHIRERQVSCLWEGMCKWLRRVWWSMYHRHPRRNIAIIPSVSSTMHRQSLLYHSPILFLLPTRSSHHTNIKNQTFFHLLFNTTNRQTA